MKKVIKSYWWEDGDLHLETQEGETIILKNAYWSDIRFDGLDYNSSEIVELTQRYE